MHVSTCTYMYVCMYVCMHVLCMYVCMYTCMFCVCMFVCMYVHACTCMYVCMYTCTCMYMHVRQYVSTHELSHYGASPSHSVTSSKTSMTYDQGISRLEDQLVWSWHERILSLFVCTLRYWWPTLLPPNYPMTANISCEKPLPSHKTSANRLKVHRAVFTLPVMANIYSRTSIFHNCVEWSISAFSGSLGTFFPRGLDTQHQA